MWCAISAVGDSFAANLIVVLSALSRLAPERQESAAFE
jgi:hypothetical protein